MVLGQKFSCGVLGPEDAVIGLQPDEVMTWLRPLERDRCGWPGTSLTLGEAYVEQILYEETHLTYTRLESNLIEYIKHTNTHASA